MLVFAKLINYTLKKTGPKIHASMLGKRYDALIYDVSLNENEIGIYKHATRKDVAIRIHYSIYTYELCHDVLSNDSHRIHMICYLYNIKHIDVVDIYIQDQFLTRTINLFNQSKFVPIPKVKLWINNTI